MTRPGNAGARILVVGAGVIGRIYAARLSAAGNDVDLLARGRTLANLAAGVLTVRTNGRSTTQRISVVDSPRAQCDTAFVAAGFAVARTDHMGGWLATHALFVTTVCAALDRTNLRTDVRSLLPPGAAPELDAFVYSHG